MSDTFGHMDNDFEKVSCPEDEEFTSSGHTGTSAGIEDLKGLTTQSASSDFDQLIDFGEPAQKTTPEVPIKKEPIEEPSCKSATSECKYYSFGEQY